MKKIAFTIVLLLVALAALAPYLASDKPYRMVDTQTGDVFYPVFKDYPEFRHTPFRALKQDPRFEMWFPPIPYNPTEYNLDEGLQAPSAKHWLGTDEQGRDIAARMLHGARVSLSVGLVAVAIYTLIGVLLGALAGYFGGKVDLVLSRLIEVMICFPTFFLILAVIAFIGPGLVNIMIVIGLTSWTGVARLVRGEFLKYKNQPFAIAAKNMGYSHLRVMFRHIFPNALGPLLVMVTFGVASSILVESSLSFLGFGVQPPAPSWGSILSQSREFMDFAWWLTFFPGLAIFLTITCFNILGESLRERFE